MKTFKQTMKELEDDIALEIIKVNHLKEIKETLLKQKKWEEENELHK